MKARYTEGWTNIGDVLKECIARTPPPHISEEEFRCMGFIDWATSARLGIDPCDSEDDEQEYGVILGQILAGNEK